MRGERRVAADARARPLRPAAHRRRVGRARGPRGARRFVARGAFCEEGGAPPDEVDLHLKIASCVVCTQSLSEHTYPKISLVLVLLRRRVGLCYTMLGLVAGAPGAPPSPRTLLGHVKRCVRAARCGEHSLQNPIDQESAVLWQPLVAQR